MERNESLRTIEAEAWQAPDYVNPAAFDEREVTVGSGDFAVPGTLSMPRGDGPYPAVVLLAGGGPFDRDGTVGPNRIYRDISWGLASRGIAVLRFDKVTFAHAEKVAATMEFTMRDEYLPHARAGIEMLCAAPTVDSGRVFVVGHSMGGKVAPRVAEAVPALAGMVLLAADTQPMQWAMVRVLRHLAEIDPASVAAFPPIETIIEQAKLVDSQDLSDATPAADLPFGMSAAYWLDLRAYDPVAVAATLDKPMLILQGERDYQVTVADDLAGWQVGLDDRPDVTIRTYPVDDHLFFPGTGPSMPADYQRLQHVDAAVIADIAEWVRSH
ncbi:alpha/beta hydrolase [Nocardia sp. NBC_00565]|uniref:alpha/beta hydrolase family protein n=1 Tax=Nocardia sp. NBC_00565 TaxID=2975993 RepID=UPI002E7FF591|nr:alpha/beta fold hydrolase [Nocardia sp. NBC_00565]WUC02857.1 alpha/beta hydrolase [Nocardia sp. NBC_00565]